METQANAPAPAQAQEPVHAIIEENNLHARLTDWVSKNRDNDPHTGTDLEASPEEPAAQETPATEEPQPEGALEFDEETPFFDLDYNGEKKKLSAKELREGYLAKQDYHRNIQKVKAEEAAVQKRVQEATLQAQHEYLQRLEVQKQAVLKTVAPELQGIDLNKLAMDDPAEAQRLFFRQIQVNQTLQAIEQEQRQAAEKLNAERQSQFQQAAKQAWETLTAEVPGWNEETYNGLLKFAKDDYGFDATQVVDARLLKALHDAKQYRQLQKAKPEVAKKVVAVPKVVKPGSADKPNPASDTAQLERRLKKSGDWRDAAQLYLARQKTKK